MIETWRQSHEPSGTSFLPFSFPLFNVIDSWARVWVHRLDPNWQMGYTGMTRFSSGFGLSIVGPSVWILRIHHLSSPLTSTVCCAGLHMSRARTGWSIIRQLGMNELGLKTEPNWSSDGRIAGPMCHLKQTTGNVNGSGKESGYDPLTSLTKALQNIKHSIIGIFSTLWISVHCQVSSHFKAQLVNWSVPFSNLNLTLTLWQNGPVPPSKLVGILIHWWRNLLTCFMRPGLKVRSSDRN